jgi:hypothetical protein
MLKSRTLTREHTSDKEQIESQRASLGDLEEIVFREIAVPPKKRKGQKNSAVADVPNRHRSVQHNAEFEQIRPRKAVPQMRKNTHVLMQKGRPLLVSSNK